MTFKKAVTAAAVSVITAAAVASCSPAPALTYAPAAYGVPGHCYYADSAAEAIALQAAGLCPRSWVPTLMPLAWEEEYYSYYSSPAYYDTYVPARVRTVYVQHETTFGKSNQAAIKTRSKAATYRTSTGKTVKGTQVTSKTQFGSGKSFGSSGQKYGGGSLRPGTSTGSKSGTSKTGSSGSVSKSGSSRSGSLRSGSSGSHSSSHSGSRK